MSSPATPVKWEGIPPLCIFTDENGQEIDVECNMRPPRSVLICGGDGFMRFSDPKRVRDFGQHLLDLADWMGQG